jgi:O-antigen/teichoic acid export membrane protein
MTLFLTLINADGRPRKSFLIAGAAAAADLALNLALVPRLGIRGAAVASLIACGAGMAGRADVLRVPVASRPLLPEDFTTSAALLAVFSGPSAVLDSLDGCVGTYLRRHSSGNQRNGRRIWRCSR